MTCDERNEPVMAIPITPTPVLEGDEAEEFWNKVESEKNQKLELVPTPKLDIVRREILINAKRREK
jgi:hypothetical protein